MKNSPKKFNFNFLDSQKFLIRDFKSEYIKNKNIDYIVLDNFLKKEHVEEIAKEHNNIPEEYWLKYNHFNQKKMGISDLSLMGNKTQLLIDELSSIQFTSWLNNLTGFKNLISDMPKIFEDFLHDSFLTLIIFLSEYCAEAPSVMISNVILFFGDSFFIVPPIPKTSSSGCGAITKIFIIKIYYGI